MRSAVCHWLRVLLGWRRGRCLTLILPIIFWINGSGWALEENPEAIRKIEDIEVRAKKTSRDVVLAPEKTVIDMDLYQSIGPVYSVTDILDNRAIFDFQGQSDIVPSNDSIQMRGFNTLRFVTAVDGLTVEKSGFGSAGNYAVDFAQLALGPVEKIEILYGPHSCLYPGQSIGGVVNLTTKKPALYASKKPDAKLSTSYKSYNTHSHKIDVAGGVGAANYGLGYQKHHTDGYLRHNETDIDTLYARLGWLLPAEGDITLLGSYTNQDREQPVNNDPSRDDYDENYPTVTNSPYDPWQDTSMDKESYTFRLDGRQPTPLGTWNLGAYYNHELQDRYIWVFVDSKDPSQGIMRGNHLRDVIWEQMGAKLSNEIRFSDNHVSTIGVDGTAVYTEYRHATRHKRLERWSGYFQHAWDILPSLNLTAGLRYEDVSTAIFNGKPDSTGEIVGYYNNAVQTEYIDKHYSDLAPKSFLTYQMDRLADVFRDTSLSLGVSKIWRAPTSGMEMQGSGIPGFYVDPEHGIGYDAIFSRRLWETINLRLGYGYYEIKDYIAYSNKTYAKYIPGPGHNVEPGMEYLDGRINLEKVIRHGVDVELNGNLFDNLSFYAGYSWQDFENKGTEPVAKEELDDRAKHHVNAGLRYNLFKRTALMVDYKYQSEQVAYTSNLNNGVWVFSSTPMDAYNLFDFSVEQVLFEKIKYLQDGRLTFFVNNLFNTSYMDSRGYPMTDRTFGVAFRMAL